MKKIFSWWGPNTKQGRLYYFCIFLDLETVVVTSDIGISYRSDHSPVCMKLKFYNQTRGLGTWKFNNSLLTATEFVNKVKQNLNEVVTKYEYDSNIDLYNPDKTFIIDGHLFWETIKMKIRGTAISCSSYKKKEKDKNKKFLHVKFSTQGMMSYIMSYFLIMIIPFSQDLVKKK